MHHVGSLPFIRIIMHHVGSLPFIRKYGYAYNNTNIYQSTICLYDVMQNIMSIISMTCVTVDA